MMSRSDLILTTSPRSQPTKNPDRTPCLPLRQRPLYGRKRYYRTVKERDSETGLYYYGARYLDSRMGRWISGDPAMGEYVPEAPVDDEARKRNQNLPGMGGVFNTINLHAYHYSFYNPITYIDPDGRDGNTFMNILRSMEAAVNDNSTRIFTIGVTFSETMLPQSGAVGYGIYINPRNDAAFLAIASMLTNPVTMSFARPLLALNIEDAGFYGELALGGGVGIGPVVVFGTSGSATITIGMFDSVEDFAGFYMEVGLSGTYKKYAVGIDAVFDLLSGKNIGVTLSVGLGAGTAPAEVHKRTGGTFVLPLFKGVIPLNED